MSKFNIFSKDYSKINEFERIGYTYRKIYEDSDYIVWSMEMEGAKYFRCEVWKKSWRKQPDGSLYLHGPSDEEFGTSGWYFVGSKEKVKNAVAKQFQISIL